MPGQLMRDHSHSPCALVTTLLLKVSQRLTKLAARVVRQIWSRVCSRVGRRVSSSALLSKVSCLCSTQRTALGCHQVEFAHSSTQNQKLPHRCNYALDCAD